MASCVGCGKYPEYQYLGRNRQNQIVRHVLLCNACLDILLEDEEENSSFTNIVDLSAYDLRDHPLFVNLEWTTV